MSVGIGSYPAPQMYIQSVTNAIRTGHEAHIRQYYSLRVKEIGSLDKTEIKGFCFNFL